MPTGWDGEDQRTGSGMSGAVPQPALYRRPVDTNSIEQAFDGDLFERQKLADRLTSFLVRLPDGAVLAIDAPWGEGKTWFGRNWHAQLASAGYRTVYIDCFQRDHIEDPFLMVAGELLELAKASQPAVRGTLMAAGKKLGAALIPAAVKFAANAAGHWAIGNAELGDNVAKSLTTLQDSVTSGLEKLVAKNLEDYEADKKSVEGFRSALKALAAEEDKPIVVFLDELDRCRPDFAVRTVERVKHFFDVPNVIFVLMMNRRQLTAAIEGIYGPRIDANAYLGKFVQLSLTLPKQDSLELHSQDDSFKHCQKTLLSYGHPQTNASYEFATALSVMASLLGLSLRDIELGVVLFSLAQPVREHAMDIAWPIALKLAKPELFRKLLANDREAHGEAYRLAASLKSSGMTDILNLVAEVHNSGSGGFEKPLPPEQAQMIRGLMGGPKYYFRDLFGRIDLAVST